MDFEIISSTVKGIEETKLILSPVGNLETEFFNALFSGEVKVERMPGNSNEIIIRKINKPESLS